MQIAADATAPAFVSGTLLRVLGQSKLRHDAQIDSGVRNARRPPAFPDNRSITASSTKSIVLHKRADEVRVYEGLAS